MRIQEFERLLRQVEGQGRGMKPREKMIDGPAAVEEMRLRDLEARAAAALPFPPSEDELDELIEQAVISAAVKIAM